MPMAVSSSSWAASSGGGSGGSQLVRDPRTCAWAGEEGLELERSWLGCAKRMMAEVGWYCSAVSDALASCGCKMSGCACACALRLKASAAHWRCCMRAAGRSCGPCNGTGGFAGRLQAWLLLSSQALTLQPGPLGLRLQRLSGCLGRGAAAASAPSAASAGAALAALVRKKVCLKCTNSEGTSSSSLCLLPPVLLWPLATSQLGVLRAMCLEAQVTSRPRSDLLACTHVTQHAIE